MVSKSTSILLAVAVVAVSAVAIIGLGYAYTASTENSGNTTGVTYITLTPNEYISSSWTATYTSTFDNSVKYDTVNASGTITYTLNEAQKVNIYDSVKGIELGKAQIAVGHQGTISDYVFSVTNTAGTMNGSFIIGYSLDDSSWVFKTYSPGSVNYYTASGHDAVTEKPAANIDDEVTTIYVKMFATSITPSATLDSVKPLNGVTFQFTAEVPEPAH